MIVGQTGSGKTILSMSLLYSIKRLLVVDSKDSFEGKYNLETWNDFSVDKIRNQEPFRIRVVEDEQALKAMRLLYQVGDGIVYIDEVNAIIPPRKNANQVFVDIWQRGRERRVGAWAASQRPRSIPLLFLTEAYHYFIFRLNNEDDRKLMASYTDKRVLEPIRDPYGFYYYNVIQNRLIYNAKLRT